VRSAGGWADAATYTVSDLTMLRKELVIGFLVAGFADAAVPVSFWKHLFITGHGAWSVLENVLLGPFLAIISFVCSIGNVPLAAALWTGGISFGGTVAFVFADLIALPLLFIYRRYYGTRLTLKLLAVFWATMSVAGLVTEYLFKGLGILPAPETGEHGMVGRDVFGWNYTTVLDVIALVAMVGIYWLYRNRERFGGGSGYAKDPVCGMQVQTAHAPAQRRHGEHTVYFCSDHCAHRFDDNPDRFTPAGAETTVGADTAAVTDPVCGMTVDPEHAAAHVQHAGRDYYFCNPGCRDAFVAAPQRYVADAATATAIDPVCGMTVDPEHAAAHVQHAGRDYYFCNPGCRDAFVAAPERYVDVVVER
jgi:YHS domain-containing protein